jgi:hypothetical protein
MITIYVRAPRNWNKVVIMKCMLDLKIIKTKRKIKVNSMKKMNGLLVRSNHLLYDILDIVVYS